MELNPTLVMICGLVVFLLALLIKQFSWSPEGRPMLWLVVGISVLFGTAQIVLGWQGAPFPVWPGAPPTGVVAIAFVWVPTVIGWAVAVVVWVGTPCAAVFAAAQLYYALIKKGLLPEPEKV